MQGEIPYAEVTHEETDKEIDDRKGREVVREMLKSHDRKVAR
jgi:hypothetical protein